MALIEVNPIHARSGIDPQHGKVDVQENAVFNNISKKISKLATSFFEFLGSDSFATFLALCGGALAGGVVGGAIGSAVPIIGTTVGAVVGAILGTGIIGVVAYDSPISSRY